jgi:FKBP-type peptidyl-prolyl cis-trans isomerase FklB
MKKTVFAFISMVGVALFTGCNQQTQPVSTNTNADNTAASSPAAAPNAATPASATASSSTAEPVLTSDKEKESYAMGMYFGTGWKKNGVDVDIDLLARGIKDAESTNSTLLTEEQMKAALMQLQQNVMANRRKVQSEEGDKNKQAGEQFLAENKTKPGVVTLADGLQYKIITDGTGPAPGSNDMVSVNYRGTFVDGTEFDSSFKRGRPADFPIRGVIPGWTEALELMKVGSKWELYIPYDLAYGPSGRPPLIGPNETLVFEVELLAAHAPPPPPPPPQPLTSDIIKVPSAQDMKNGAQIETIKASDLQKMQQTATNNSSQ